MAEKLNPRMKIVAGVLSDDQIRELNARFPQKTKVRPIPGPKGDRGPAGVRGLDGTDGVDGAKGDRGDRGPKGPKGEQGEPGEDGLNVYQGEGVPPRSLGVDGESYIDNVKGKLYEKRDGVWFKTGTLRGKDGKRGAPGEPGPQGPRGRQGPAGMNLGGATIFVGDGDPPPGGIVGRHILVGDGDPNDL